MKNYWYIPTGNLVWLDVAVQLYESGVAKPVLWTGDDRHFDSARKKFGDAVISKQMLVFYPETLPDVDLTGADLDFVFSENYRTAKDRCLKMMDRLDLYGAYNRLDRDAIFNNLVYFILKKFQETEPSFLIVSENPHSHTHYLIYEICNYYSVKIFKFNTWLPIPVLYAQNVVTGARIPVLNGLSPSVSKAFDKELIEFVDKIASNKSEEKTLLPAIRQQLDEVRLSNKLKYFVKFGAIDQVKEFWFQFRKYFSSVYYPINPYKIGYFHRRWVQYSRRRNLKKQFLAACEVVDLKAPYVFFALCFEPERTTNPDGGVFHDQLAALAAVRAFTPSKYKIFVKEHPSQFLRADRGSRGRSPLFYKAARALEGVHFVEPIVSSSALTKKAAFVATVSGSVAVEAAILGKKALIFGDVWYDGMPNITRWEKNVTFYDFEQQPVEPISSIKSFLIEQKNKYCIAAYQNISAQQRFRDYVEGVFKKEEFEDEEIRGLTLLLCKIFEQKV